MAIKDYNEMGRTYSTIGDDTPILVRISRWKIPPERHSLNWDSNIVVTMSCGSLVTSARHVFRFRIKETASRCGG
jgi:hypothetical protein